MLLITQLCVIIKLQSNQFRSLDMKTPKLQIRLNEKQTAARDFLQECGYDVNFLVRQFIIQLYEKEQAKRSLA